MRESLTPAVKAGASTHKSALIRSVRRSKNATASRHSLARARTERRKARQKVAQRVSAGKA